MISLPPAPSDSNELRSHFQFVLPDDAADDAAPNNSNDQKQYGSSWQQRMVQHYHSHLYKEYVLADLSRVMDLGKVGLRWWTKMEVANGRGFRCCGNLMCKENAAGNGSNIDTTLGNAGDDDDKEAYCAAAMRHMGIGVAENGGKEPIGVVLPPSEDANTALELYLQSCATLMIEK